MVSSQHTYSYEPLPQNNAIRSPFEAISYVWGSKERTHEIICGRFSRKRVAITANLRDALKGVRWPDKARVLWADSICIDQENRKEQGHQVALMGQIYQKAARVLIFVGVNPGQHGVAVKSLLADTRKMIQEVLESVHFAENAFPYPAEDDPLLSDRRWVSMKALFDLPWFFRGWVVQEAGLAVEATVIWGDAEFDWLDLLRTYFWVGSRAIEVWITNDFWLNNLHILMYERRHYQEALAFQSPSVLSDVSFHEILEMARDLVLTDERDQVYAFIALQSNVAIEPNYEASYLQVYLDFALNYLLSTHDLTLLDVIQHTEDTIASEYPTWVPRWNTFSHTVCWHRSDPPITSPSVLLPLQPTLAAGNALKVQAVLFDSINFQFPLGNESGLLDRISTLWRHLSDLPMSSSFPLHCRGLIFAQTLRHSQYLGTWKRWVAHQAAFMLYLRQVRTEDGLDATELARLEQRAIGGSVEHFIGYIRQRLINRSFVMTNRGYYGIAPSTVPDGDICAIIFGARAPFALRTTQKQGCYKVLGNVGITSKENGWMEGEKFFHSLGEARDWLELGLQEEDILLV